MPDRMQAQIEIGGQISRTQFGPGNKEFLIRDLVSEIVSEGVQDEFGDRDIRTIDETDAALLEFLNDSGYLQFRCDEKRNGEFEELENFLREAGIPYRRWHEAKYEYPGEDVYWNPGMKEPLILYCDGDVREIVLGEKVREALKDVSFFAENYGTSDDPNHWERLHAGIRRLKELCPEIPENMPKFEIVA